MILIEQRMRIVSVGTIARSIAVMITYRNSHANRNRQVEVQIEHLMRSRRSESRSQSDIESRQSAIATPLAISVQSIFQPSIFNSSLSEARLSSDPMPPLLAHGPGRSDDTVAHTTTAQGASHADRAGTCTT